MYILSFDVGIKHLAYCLFYLDEAPKTRSKKCPYSIKQWDIIDLCNTKTYKCMYNKCGKNASVYKNEEYYCKLHAKKHNNFMLTDETLKMKPAKLKKKSLFDLKQIVNTYSIKIEEKAKKSDYIKAILEYIDLKCFQPIEKTNASDFNLVSLGINMKDAFEKLFSEFEIEHVLIENQISPIANRMKCIQGMMTQYFIMKGIENIEFISSANKLKPFIDKKKTTYAERKKIGITVTRRLVNEKAFLDKWKELFNNHKKKDDLADSFLQGLWYLRENEEIEDVEIFKMK